MSELPYFPPLRYHFFLSPLVKDISIIPPTRILSRVEGFFSQSNNNPAEEEGGGDNDGEVED